MFFMFGKYIPIFHFDDLLSVITRSKFAQAKSELKAQAEYIVLGDLSVNEL